MKAIVNQDQSSVLGVKTRNFIRKYSRKYVNIVNIIFFIKKLPKF